jgi:hypothetical protein
MNKRNNLLSMWFKTCETVLISNNDFSTSSSLSYESEKLSIDSSRVTAVDW